LSWPAKPLKGTAVQLLRHSFASIAVASGLSLPIIGKLLGHTKAVTTKCYAHLTADPIRAANNAIASHIADALQSGSRGRSG
jgi:site-specific recombinase XerD